MADIATQPAWARGIRPGLFEEAASAALGLALLTL
jgi:hypothetical protein